MGDFNCVLNGDERLGRPVSEAEIREFRQCVGACSLQELKSSGSFFTWNNKQGADSRVYSRIDRLLVNLKWITTLPTSEVHYGNQGLYDHCPVFINWDTGNAKVAHRFKYYNMWSLAAQFKEKVQASWGKLSRGSKMFQLFGKLNRLKAVLKEINRINFSEVELSTERALENLYACQTKL
ncbi:hypothetical protein K7X08_016563 [Anisodus acutangulus]|uniref:Endonuclease/exonuclease/phosphatase domain-containing protein n=1 Tax=Anisodus acutangulus TaxID=402998 RepID=A0A9Q1LHJ1_9SOLA|nr:hypothetical protein K7X08_016563 [Anisodus acutangulus]